MSASPDVKADPSAKPVGLPTAPAPALPPVVPRNNLPLAPSLAIGNNAAAAAHTGSSSPLKEAVARELPKGMDPAYYALSLLRRRQLEKCTSVSSYFLKQNASKGKAASVDELLWFVQTKAMVLQSWYEDAELEDDGVDDVLMEGEGAVVSSTHQPNTSLKSAAPNLNTTAGRLTAAQKGASRGAMGSRAGIGTGGRPVSSRYGFARPGTVGNRPGSVAGRGGTAGMRPITGRFVRLGTASLQSVPGGPHIDVQRLNMEKMAREHPMIAKLLCEYILYVEHLPKLALDLCTAALKVTEARAGSEGETESKTQMQVGIRNSEDWWWKARLGKANYQLGLLRDAEKHFKAALFEFPPHATAQERSSRFYHYDTTVVMELAKVYIKMDQPLTAMELYMTALEFNPVDHLIVLCSARLHDELHDSYKAFELYSNVLALDSSNIEAIACTAAFFFYEKNQPELALRFYRRLLQMGVQNSEVWNNIGLCGYYTCQFDFALRCLDRALSQCTTALNKADVWYNIGHVGIGLGDMTFAKRAFRLAVSADPTHGEALNNLSVLSLSSEVDKKDSSVLLHSAVSVAPELLEALYNSALQCFKNGELEESYNYVIRALDVLPDHAESINLHEKILKKFTSL